MRYLYDPQHQRWIEPRSTGNPGESAIALDKARKKLSQTVSGERITIIFSVITFSTKMKSALIFLVKASPSPRHPIRQILAGAVGIALASEAPDKHSLKPPRAPSGVATMGRQPAPSPFPPSPRYAPRGHRGKESREV